MMPMLMLLTGCTLLSSGHSGSDRLPCWSMNAPGGESALPALGL